jgi:hypothetical protein
MSAILDDLTIDNGAPLFEPSAAEEAEKKKRAREALLGNAESGVFADVRNEPEPESEAFQDEDNEEDLFPLNDPNEPSNLAKIFEPQQESGTFQSDSQKSKKDLGLEELESLEPENPNDEEPNLLESDNSDETSSKVINNESDEAEEKSGFSTRQKIGIGIFIGCAAAVGLTLIFTCPPVVVIAAAVVAAKFLGPAIIAAGHVAIPAIVGAAKVAAGAILGAAGATAGAATAAAGATVGAAATATSATVSTATAAAGLAGSAMTKAAATFVAAPTVAKVALTAVAGIAATSVVKKGFQGMSSLLSRAAEAAGLKDSVTAASDKSQVTADPAGITRRGLTASTPSK